MVGLDDDISSAYDTKFQKEGLVLGQMPTFTIDLLNALEVEPKHQLKIMHQISKISMQ